MENVKTLQQAIIYFKDYPNCHNLMVALRWPDGVVKCPACGSEKVTYLAKARVWKCYSKHPKAKFSLKTGTIFEDSPISLDKWLTALWLVVNCKNGISSMEMHRDLGVTQKTAWFMNHRLRAALNEGGFMLSGEVEVDETFIGGKARNMHIAVKKRRITGTGGKDKAKVMGCSNGAARFAQWSLRLERSTNYTRTLEQPLKRVPHSTAMSCDLMTALKVTTHTR